MNFAEYPALAARTEKLFPSSFARLEHAELGLTTEIGEAATPIKRIAIYGKTLDSLVEKGEDKGKTLRQLIAEEIGDVLWYLAIIENVCAFALFQQLPQAEPDLEAVDQVTALKMISRGLSVYGGRVSLYVEVEAEGGDGDSEVALAAAATGILQELANLAHVIGGDLAQIAADNIAKLQKRYPEAYSDLAAEARADKGGEDARNS